MYVVESEGEASPHLYLGEGRCEGRCEGRRSTPHTYPHTVNYLCFRWLLWMGEGVRVKRPKKIFVFIILKLHVMLQPLYVGSGERLHQPQVGKRLDVAAKTTVVYYVACLVEIKVWMLAKLTVGELVYV